MTVPEVDNRSEARRAEDERIATEPMMDPPASSTIGSPLPMEAHLSRRRPVAVAGVVENGVVRLLDPQVSLPERSRVIVVATP